MKVSELEGIILDWAVATCEGFENLEPVRNRGLKLGMTQYLSKDRSEYIKKFLWELNYHEAWELTGPIIERELLSIEPQHKYNSTTGEGSWIWVACVLGPTNIDGSYESCGPTPLVAAMRCYVASKLGNEVEIPKELL